MEKGMWFIDKKELKKAFIDEVKSDIKLLEEIKKKWFGDGPPADPKLECFDKIIKEKLKKEPERKIVVFTEFADTADYLYEKLKNDLRVFKYSAGDASEKNKLTIRENFDAGNRIQKNDYDVLIATDAISEGFNLHRAGAVFNYDIPYNPTRVIQRVGRINRINKKVFDELFIYNYFPTETGEQETHIKRVSTLKISMIHALFGEDTKVLTKDEELESYFAKQLKEALKNQEELSPEAKYENFIKNLRAKNPEIIKQAMKVPKRCRVKRTVTTDKMGVIVFGKKGEEYAFKYGSKPGECISMGVAEALRIFEAEVSEKPEKTTTQFEKIYEEINKKLFSKKTEVATDKGKADAINKVIALKERLKDKRDYLEDLLYVMKDLDSLPDRYAKLIRAINLKNIDEDFKELQAEVPHKYLISIIEREREIEEGKESLILSEELI